MRKADWRKYSIGVYVPDSHRLPSSQGWLSRPDPLTRRRDILRCYVDEKAQKCYNPQCSQIGSLCDYHELFGQKDFSKKLIF
jgi:hypothetical protein